jgi:hypothetical protein
MQINMNNNFKLLLFLFVLSIYGKNNSTTIPIGYFTSIDEESVMEIFCRNAWEENKLKSDSIDCDCNQIIISFPDTFEINKQTKEFDSIAMKNPKEVRKQVDDLCSSIKNGNNLKYPHQWQLELQKKLKNMCNDPNCRKNPTTILKAFDMDKSTMKLKINSFRMGFKNNGNGKWVSYETNLGLCGLDMIVTIEKENKYFWKYTQILTAISDNPSLLCIQFKESLNKPIIFIQEKEPIFKVKGYEYIEISP